jgi:amino acid transporter
MIGRHRRLSGWHAVVVTFGALFGVGALYVPDRVENLAGPATPLAFLAATAGALALGVGYAVFLSGPLGDEGGGAYLHLSRTWRSRALGFLLVWPKPAAYAAFLALLARFLAGTLALPVADDTLAVAVLAGLLLVHLAGPVVLGWLGLLLAGGFTLFLVGLSLASLPEVVLGNFSPLLPTSTLRERPLVSLGRATLVAAFGFVGFETVAALAGDVRSPRETLPRVVLLGVAGAGLLVTALTFVTLGVIPWTRMVFAQAPFADAAAAGLGVGVGTVLRPGVVLGALAALVAFSWAPTRALAGLGEVVPPLAHTNRVGTPDVACVVVVAAAAALVLLDAVFVGLFLAVPGLLVLYVAHGLTAAALPVVNPALYAESRLRPAPRLLALSGLVGAGCAAVVLWGALTLDPVVVVGHTRLGPALADSTADRLLRRPIESAIPALVGWETLGVLVYVAARDYREEVGVELEPLTRF